MGDGPDGLYHLRRTRCAQDDDLRRCGRWRSFKRVRQLGVFANRADVVRKMVERLERRGRQLRFCYEAGPCGYGLHRLLTGLGHACTVVAPSLIPIKARDRIKTDRRDARMLARLHRDSAKGAPLR
jgi:transposase